MNRMIWMIVAAGIAIVAAFVFFANRSGLSGTEARSLVTNGARLVDVRTAEEFASGHIEGAVNIPVQDLDRRMRELEPASQPLVVYCRSGMRSRRASQMLRDQGFTSVHDLGAMSRW